MFDGKAFGEEMVGIVRGFVERATAPLAAEIAAMAARNAELEGRLAAVEAREIPAEFDPSILQAGVDKIARAVDALPVPDLTPFATKEDIEAIRGIILGLPAPADLSPFATKADVDAVRAAIPEIPPAPDLSGFATRDDVDASIAALPIPTDYSDAIEDLRRAIPKAPDLSGFATREDLEAVRGAISVVPEAPDLTGFATRDDLAAAVEAVKAEIPPLPEAPDLSGFATRAEVDAVRDEIPEIPAAPDLSGFATHDDLEAVKAVIPATPDLSGFATKADLAALPAPHDFGPDIAEVRRMVESVEMPEVIHGKDADPELIARMVDAAVAHGIEGIPVPKDGEPGRDADPEVIARMVADATAAHMAEIESRVDARLAAVKDGEPGKDGMLPVARAWSDAVHYAGAVVTHRGATWQASADTGREPPHADWICLAAPGRDGAAPEFVGTYDDAGEYRALDVVALNGGSFVALRDAPGPCPGDGWQLVASRGKPGQAIKGDPGKQGEPGRDAAEVVGFYREGDSAVITFADGREMRA